MRASDILEKIILDRRSVRSFQEKAPSEEVIVKIIKAGLHAPYAAAAVRDMEGFRKFYVIRKSSPAYQRFTQLLENHVKRSLIKLNSLPMRLMGVTRKLAPLLKRLTAFRIPDAPYIIIIAEKNGVPAVAPQALAHVAQNMWLTTQGFEMGFQLLSILEAMKKDGALCEFLGIWPGDYSLLGCAIGYPSHSQTQSQRPAVESIIHWL